MNVFVLNTGRCGSMTFANACNHITNYSSAHESRSHMIGPSHFDYPPSHIEIDNRLAWLLGRLDRYFGDDAAYVHLLRDPEKTASSFVRRYDTGIMHAYRGSGVIMGLPRDSDPFAVALDYCDTVNSNIELFLKDKTRKMLFRLESANDDFPRFCEMIAAECDLESALAEFGTSYNASSDRPARTGPRSAPGRLMDGISHSAARVARLFKSADSVDGGDS